jgi:hypothetical protein
LNSVTTERFRRAKRFLLPSSARAPRLRDPSA